MKTTFTVWCAGLVGAALLAGSGWRAVAAPTSQFTVTGDVSARATYALPALQALPVATKTVTYQTASGPQTGSFAGPTLWSLLNTVGLQSPAVKNGVLRQYVVTTGSDGYTAVFSLGELDPNFGGGSPQVLVADEENGAPLGSTGFARTVAAKDDYGARYVSNLTNLRVGTAPALPAEGGGTTTQFTLSGGVTTPGTYTRSRLQALPATTEMVTYLSGGTSVTASFTGVSLWTLLSDAGIVTNPSIKNDILNYYVLATGSDGYEAVFSLGELDPMFGGAGAPDLIAYEENAGSLGADGFARILVPGDDFGGRYVSNLVSLEVLDAAVPEPATFVLLASALTAMGLFRARLGVEGGQPAGRRTLVRQPARVGYIDASAAPLRIDWKEARG